MVLGQPGDTEDRSIRLKIGVLSNLNTNEQQVYSWFGGNYFTRLLGIVSERLRAAARQAELIVRIGFSMGRAIGSANQYTDGRVVQLSRSVSSLKRILFNDYTQRISQLASQSAASDRNILNQASRFFNSSLDFTKREVGELGRNLSGEINSLRFDTFGTFGQLIPGISVLSFLGNSITLAGVENLLSVAKIITKPVIGFLAEPLAFILGWLITNLINLIMDLLATEIGGGKGVLDEPVFSSDESL